MILLGYIMELSLNKKRIIILIISFYLFINTYHHYPLLHNINQIGLINLYLHHIYKLIIVSEIILEELSYILDHIKQKLNIPKIH